MSVCYSLRAKNSGGFQLLHFDVDRETEEVDICLTGILDNNQIQIDFDRMSKDEFYDFFEVMEIIKKRLGDKINENKLPKM